MMNLVEKLAREIKRVTEIKGHYEALRGQRNVIVEPQIAMMEAELEQACLVIGRGDIPEMMATIASLQETTD